ncbi:uncharacterized protein LOC134529178 [Bacillus rossius redtenbacheri]|uniref:uncharacterized protein LOC134529178 n=1 Tax=Bacillus rossius redtenbacheri TaxID=93214 RepID=UPI002FDE40F3
MQLLPVLLLATRALTSAASSAADGGRVLVYPDQGGLHKLVMGVSVPVGMAEKLLSWAVNLQFQYQLPQNVSEIRQSPRAPERDWPADTWLTRRHLYRALEEHLDRNEVDGRACVLRTVCQVAEAPLHHNGLLGELLHVFFTPAGDGPEILDEYRSAQDAGVSSGADCHDLYPDCSPGHGLLDLVAYDSP